MDRQTFSQKLRDPLFHQKDFHRHQRDHNASVRQIQNKTQIEQLQQIQNRIDLNFQEDKVFPRVLSENRYVIQRQLHF